MGSSDVSDIMISSSSDTLVHKSSYPEGTENFSDDIPPYEAPLLEEWDSYWEDINGRLTVSRMVTDSVIKGMVSAISEEAAETITMKETEMALLNKKLSSYKSNLRNKELELEGIKCIFPLSSSHTNDEWKSFKEHLSNISLASEENFQRIKKGIKAVKSYCSASNKVGMNGSNQQEKLMETFSGIEVSLDTLGGIINLQCGQVEEMVLVFNSSLDEHKRNLDFQEEVLRLVLQSYMKSLQQEFQAKLVEERGQNRNFTPDFDDKLRRLRQELDTISMSLVVPEPGKLQTVGSQEGFEEWTHRKVLGNYGPPAASLGEENGNSATGNSDLLKNTTSETLEAAQLMHMKKDDLISYFQSERMKLKRSHESMVQEMTEQYFRLKREYLKEQGSSHLRRDKELDFVRKRIPDVILKLDGILVENEKLQSTADSKDAMHSLEKRNEALLLDNQHLRKLLQEKTEEIRCLIAKVSNASKKVLEKTLVEANLWENIKKLENDIEDARVETFIGEEIYKSIIKEKFSELRFSVEDSDLVAVNMYETFEIIYKEIIGEFEANMNLMMLKSNMDKGRIIHLENSLLENEKALHSAVVEKERLKQEVSVLSTSIVEKEMLASEVGFSLRKQKEHYEQVFEELNKLRDEKFQHERLVFENSGQCKYVKDKLEEALKDNGVYQAKTCELEQKLALSEKALRDAGQQTSQLHNIIQEKQRMVSSALASKEENKRQIESSISSIQILSKALTDFEHKVTESFVENKLRLEKLSHHSKPLVQQVNALKRKALLYKQSFERRCVDLQKAEEEVDLLGDEVDGLLSLLEKIYVGLDHYSPVLQHYPGIMEILKLVRRELNGENMKPLIYLQC
ncbi:WPP domain-associated protein-like [Aristolochia californica]|uniref:WPP domain-associated protein-like n=1 Tax=Aristolochia californica TaxID=171875 RepID=UPI0035DC3E59